MSKSKLEILLDEVKPRISSSLALAEVYNAYMEERNSIPQAGQEIEVRDNKKFKWVVAKFIGFTTNGRVVSEDIDGNIIYWEHYRIPTPKKKWKVVKDIKGHLSILSEDYQTDLPTITTFED